MSSTLFADDDYSLGTLVVNCEFNAERCVVKSQLLELELQVGCF